MPDIRNFFGKPAAKSKPGGADATNATAPKVDAAGSKRDAAGASTAAGASAHTSTPVKSSPAKRLKTTSPSQGIKSGETVDLTGDAKPKPKPKPSPFMVNAHTTPNKSPAKPNPDSHASTPGSAAKRTAPTSPVESPSKAKRAKPAAQKKLTKEEKAAAEKAKWAWLPPTPAEADLKFSLMEPVEGAPVFGGAAPGGDPPNRGQKELPRGRDGCLNDLTFVISGTLDSLTREECADAIKRHGGRVTGSVSGKTSYLVVGTECGNSKYKKAKELNCPLLDEDALFAILRASLTAPDSVGNAQPMDTSPLAPQLTAPASAASASAATAAPAVAAVSPPMAWNGPPASAAPRAFPAAAAGPSGSGVKPEVGSSGVGELWVNKHRPQSTKDLIGNSDKIKQLTTWLQNWHRVNAQREAQEKAGGKKLAAKDAPKKAVLLSGPPGLGKTSSANIVARALGFQVLEVNASDTRGKSDSSVEGGVAGKKANAIREMVTNRNMSFGGGVTSGGKQVLIMDEVDGMSGNGDRGGMKDLCDTIKISKIPIICICNDAFGTKMKSLQNHTLDLKFARPQKGSIALRMMEVARKEGLTVDKPTMEALVETCNNDIRWVLNSLQMRQKAASVLRYDDVKAGKGGAKDVDMSPFTVCDLLLNPYAKDKSLNDRQNLMFQDADLMPLMIQENYINFKPTIAGTDEAKRMDLLSKAADCISLGDTCNKLVRGSMKWSLLPFSMMTSVHAAAVMSGRREGLSNYDTPYGRFPQWLGKNSSHGKGKRLLGELQTHATAAAYHTASNRLAMRLEYLPVLRKALTAPLQPTADNNSGKDGIATVMDLMNAYGFSKEDWESVLELTKWSQGKAVHFKDPTSSIPTTTKAAFTRECNKDDRAVHSAEGQIKGMKKSKGKKKKHTTDDDGGMDGESESDAEDDADATAKISKISAAKLKRINFDGADGAAPGAAAAKGKGKGGRGGGGRGAGKAGRGGGRGGKAAK